MIHLDFSTEATEAFQKLHNSRVTNHTIVLCCTPESLKVELVAEYAEGQSLDDTAATFPSSEPRFAIILAEWTHNDGRKSYPIVLCCYCPEGLSPETNVVYSNAKSEISKRFAIPFVWEVRKKFRLGDEELLEKLEENRW